MNRKFKEVVDCGNGTTMGVGGGAREGSLDIQMIYG